jgi:hypothetical protein
VFAETAAPAGESNAERLQQLVQELDELVAELKASFPEQSRDPSVPTQADQLAQFLRKNLDKITPEVAKDIAASFQGATVEDFLDPDTWKGMGSMLGYSMRFQVERLKQRLPGEDGEQ